MKTLLEFLKFVVETIKDSPKIIESIGKVFDGNIVKNPFNQENTLVKHKEKSKFIFLVGSVGAGKSTIAASLTAALSVSKHVRMIRNFDAPEEFKFLVNEWNEKIINKSFPPRSDVNTLLEIDIGIRTKEDEILPLTLIEVSGEKFRSIIPFENNPLFSGSLDQKVIQNIIRADVLLVIFDATSPKKENKVVSIYLEYLESLLERYNLYKNTCIIVSKWDKVSINYSSPLVFLSEVAPNVYHACKYSKFIEIEKLVSFSIGEVENPNEQSREAKISKIDFKDSESILTWLWKTLMK